MGQYILYDDILRDVDAERTLYLAITQDIFDDIFQQPIGEVLLKNRRLNLLIFDEKQEVINQWIP